MATQSSNPYSLPSPLPHNATSSSTRAPQNISTAKAWRNRFNSLATSDTNSTSHNTEAMDEHNGLQTANTNTSTRSRHIPKWYKIRWFKGMADDVKRRAPFYLSDWTDAWDYRVVPATIYMYFANILPALAFSLDMFTKTNMSYGVNEVLLASVLGSVVFAVFAAQPLVIVGVTGPITVFNYTVYDIIVPTGANFFAFMALIGLWSLLMHWILAITNSCNLLRYVTRFSCDIFGFYVAFIYLQKGIQVLTRQGSDEPFYLSIVIALLVTTVAFLCGVVGDSPLFRHYVRVFIKDYGTPLTIIFFTGFVHIGKMREVDLTTLPTSKAFFPTIDRGWFIHFWDVRVSDVFIAIPFAILLTILFYFDHNVSSLIAQGTEYPLRKPAGFHWDIFLLGFTTGIAGLLGIPFPNGLIPQAPFHTESLCVTKLVADTDESGDSKGHLKPVTSHVVEQRVSNLAQGLLTLGTMTGPLLIVIHLIPQGVLAGLFFVMGIQALLGNGMTTKILFLLKDSSLTPSSDPLRHLPRKSAIWIFVAIQLFGFGATFAITQTIAAVGFPVIILALIPVRIWMLPRWFTKEELGVLDGATASPFTMISVGGNHGEEIEEEGLSTSVDVVREGMLVGNTSDESSGNGKRVVETEGDGDEGRAERGEFQTGGPGTERTRRKENWKGEGRSGGLSEPMELQNLGMSRRSVSRQHE
ncbi:hypothetical protein sscle_03g026190 [Sclerotinia sclerotiorum 1980 UF-70]|uniref:Bicarbonate transporter-like transmembrane domain-containing protein n=1 Tax=Sclerotinia sclerotiorum (strain ATCC 18683 / 1980 / Ss-1) TaxID=665079 RepID=A0A1D9PZ13_SCLS1|nr:hypothetical protein sscle_03g026190 [Sclerotinia sclerotiorum 1980 UF-70]